MAAPSPSPDLWRLRLRAPTDPASQSPSSPGSSWSGGAVARLQLVVAPSPGSYWPPPACMSEWHRCLWAKSPPLLHVCTAPTPVGKVTTVLHVRMAAMALTPMGLSCGIFTAKSRAHGSISAAAAGRPDSYDAKNSLHNIMCRVSSTEVDDSHWHGADVGSSPRACTLTEPAH